MMMMFNGYTVKTKEHVTSANEERSTVDSFLSDSERVAETFAEAVEVNFDRIKHTQRFLHSFLRHREIPCDPTNRDDPSDPFLSPAGGHFSAARLSIRQPTGRCL